MKKPADQFQQQRAGSAGGFSLVEILVAVALLSFIVLGLLMMFHQTQRAFRSSMTQTDILESGRIITDMLAREIEQAGPSRAEPMLLNPGPYEHTNFLVEPWPSAPPIAPLVQALPGSPAVRVNVLQSFFFMSQHGQEWNGVGYVVLQDAGPGVGSLYRFHATKRPPFVDYDLSLYFRMEALRALSVMLTNGPVTNLNKVADGIVHLQLRPFSVKGQPLLPGIGTNLVVRMPDGTFENVRDTYWTTFNGVPNTTDFAGYYFVRDAVPAAVELEVGVLEQNILGRFKALAGNAAAQRNYLSNRVANVHIFKQRIPIRNVVTSVYP